LYFYPDRGVTAKFVLAGTKNSLSENIPHPREPLRKGLDKAAIEGISIKLYSTGENNYFVLPLCKLQQSLARRRQW
jgi:hypothetical protein